MLLDMVSREQTRSLYDARLRNADLQSSDLTDSWPQEGTLHVS